MPAADDVSARGSRRGARPAAPAPGRGAGRPGAGSRPRPARRSRDAGRPAGPRAGTGARAPASPGAAAVDAVPDDRVADRLQVHPDLVGPPGLEAGLEQREAPEVLEAAQVGHRLAPVGGADRHARAAPAGRARRAGRSSARAGRRRARGPGSGGRPAGRAASAAGAGAPARSGPPPAGPEVSRSSRWTMPGRVGSPPPAMSRATRPCTSVPAAVPGARVDDHPRGLVDHQQVVVLVAHRQRDVLGLERRAGGGGAGAPRPTRPRPAGGAWARRARPPAPGRPRSGAGPRRGCPPPRAPRRPRPGGARPRPDPRPAAPGAGSAGLVLIAVLLAVAQQAEHDQDGADRDADVGDVEGRPARRSR